AGKSSRMKLGRSSSLISSETTLVFTGAGAVAAAGLAGRKPPKPEDVRGAAGVAAAAEAGAEVVSAAGFRGLLRGTPTGVNMPKNRTFLLDCENDRVGSGRLQAETSADSVGGGVVTEI